MYSTEAPHDITRWQRELDRLFPPNDTISHMHIVWEPGLPHDPLHRFMVYQMIPPAAIPLIFLPFLEGPDPRSFTVRDRITGHLRYKKGAPLISRQQWDLYRETGYMGQPYWVVQGNRGGNKLTFTAMERMISKVKGYSGEPPPIGSMPYSPFDERVLDKLVELDNIRTYNLLCDFAMRNPEMLDRAEEQGANEAKERIWSWLDSQVGSMIEELPFGAVERVGGLDAPVRIFT